MNPTPEQKQIIDYIGHTVVIAQPGSGKTFTISRKIIGILKELSFYQGVIAISYTNKASRELEKRCLENGADKKGSFFGTMDKFYITEIVFPFGRHILGAPKKELEIIDMKDNYFKEYTGFEIGEEDADNWISGHLDTITKLYVEGYVLLESISKLALFIIDNCASCRNYLKTRYKYVFIDEYQDSGADQHNVFIKLKQLNIISIAVGDVNQSIFGFSNKSSEFLIRLAQDADFKLFQITKNRRCHPSIINYATKLISKDFIEYIPSDEIRIFSKKIIGGEIDIAKWLNDVIPKVMSNFGVQSRNEIGILVRSARTGRIIQKNLTIESKFLGGTPFDSNKTLWGSVFEGILNFIYDDSFTKYELVESYLEIELQVEKARRFMRLLSELESNRDNISNLQSSITKFIEVAKIIYPRAENQNAISILNNILKSEELLECFKPADKNQIQIMSLHKSKGLEFDVVFHLDLHRYVLPKEFDGVYTEAIQDLNLHYVGITRAKQCCVLCTSTERINGKGEVKRGVPSIFLELNRLVSLRSPFIF
ncbi:UvrD-helicase domain-containing protein [Brevibacillus sp. HB2.2]|uniref:UvrD-helicase domain-containing protein n=1 Tax=Brevibacillus sp. HB2.2 TaxID=2738846 RepID=UPI00156ABB35|nr:ATP-dependent helicase [Brevibacillus sp. HB2.2]NRS46657.1 ATP-dependent helicase [Brevibacillus sp. HB2.2]